MELTTISARCGRCGVRLAGLASFEIGESGEALRVRCESCEIREEAA